MRGLGVSAARRSSNSIGSNNKVRGAVAPFRLQGQEHAAIGGARQPLLRDRRPEHVACELFEAVAIVRRDGDVGVQVEAVEVGLAGAGGGHPRRATICQLG
jgi:hypothetical protein